MPQAPWKVSALNRWSIKMYDHFYHNTFVTHKICLLYQLLEVNSAKGTYQLLRKVWASYVFKHIIMLWLI